MGLKMKKANIYGMICISVLLGITGCGAPMQDISESERGLIAEYAAELLINNSNLKTSKLDISDLEESNQAGEDGEQILEEAFYIEETEKQQEDEANSIAIGQSSVIPNITQISLEQTLRLEGCAIEYVGKEVVDTYPEEQLSFAMKATDDYRLVVFRWNVTNYSNETRKIDMMPYNLRIKMKLNDDKTYRVLTTMLINDFASYTGDILVGEKAELVMIIEVPVEECNALEKIQMIFSGNDINIEAEL